MRRSLAVSGIVALAVLGAVVLSIQPVSGGISGAPPAPPESVIVSGSVQSFPPDGGMRMTLGDESVKVVGPVDTNANITNTYVPVGMDPGAPKISAEVTGVSGGAVTTTVSGSVLISGYSSVPTVALQNGTQVSLTNTSLDALTATTGKGSCTYVDGDPTATIGTTAANIPASPMASRTGITIWNHSSAPANHLICSASGTATTTHGIRIESGHQWWKWEGLGGGVLISCRCVTGTCTYGVLEERCYQQ